MGGGGGGGVVRGWEERRGGRPQPAVPTPDPHPPSFPIIIEIIEMGRISIVSIISILGGGPNKLKSWGSVGRTHRTLGFE